MSISISSPLTGAAQTGFTSPTYTNVADAADSYSEQVAVTALGGTQTGVTAHSVSSPFTIAVMRPKQFQQLGKPNPTTGFISRVPRNTYKLIVRKGVTPAADQPIQTAIVRCEIEVPAGADTYDAANVRALLSAAIGALSNVSSGLGDTLINGVL